MTSQGQVQGTQIDGRITVAPEVARKGNRTYCRMLVALGPIGEPHKPLVTAVYVGGELAERCGRGLMEGYKIKAVGKLKRPRPKARFPELIATDIRLRDKGGQQGARA